MKWFGLILETRIILILYNRVEHFHERLDALNINYANHLYEISGQLQNEDEQLSYKLETVTKGKTILYTIDGTEPTFKSETYSNPIPIE